jgi:hypothetical protein
MSHLSDICKCSRTLATEFFLVFSFCEKYKPNITYTLCVDWHHCYNTVHNKCEEMPTKKIRLSLRAGTDEVKHYELERTVWRGGG